MCVYLFTGILEPDDSDDCVETESNQWSLKVRDIPEMVSKWLSPESGAFGCEA